MLEELKIQTDYEIINAAGVAPPVDITKQHLEWIPAAREGQVIKLKDGLGVITREALESSVGTWKNGQIFDDHKTIKAGFSIHGDKFISPFLYFLLDEVIVAHLGKSSGGSIDAKATQIDGNKVTGMTGVGYSVLSTGLMPSCTKESGCGIPIEGIVDLKKDIEAELKNEGGHKREMADKKEEVTYSEEQVTAIRAAAVAEATETLDNAHKVAVGEMETVKTAELKTLEEAHTAELVKQHDETYKQAVMVESLSAQYSLTPEAKKALTEAKTLEDALALFAGLDITKPIAAEGAADGKDGEGTGSKGGGVIQGAGEDLQGQAPKTVKVEEVGNYDALTGKYVPTFREELI